MLTLPKTLLSTLTCKLYFEKVGLYVNHLPFVFSNDGQDFGGSLYQKVNSDLETGVQMAWNAGSNATRFSLGCKYQLDCDSSVRAKIDNSSQLGLGYQQKLRPGKFVFLFPFNAVT